MVTFGGRRLTGLVAGRCTEAAPLRLIDIIVVDCVRVATMLRMYSREARTWQTMTLAAL